MTELFSRYGDVPWYEMPMPRRFHICREDNRLTAGLMVTARCACGNIRCNGKWLGTKNYRRKRYYTRKKES